MTFCFALNFYSPSSDGPVSLNSSGSVWATGVSMAATTISSTGSLGLEKRKHDFKPGTNIRVNFTKYKKVFHMTILTKTSLPPVFLVLAFHLRKKKLF